MFLFTMVIKFKKNTYVSSTKKTSIKNQEVHTEKGQINFTNSCNN